MKTLLQYFFLLFLFNISTITTTCANTTIPSFHHHCTQHQQLLLLNFKKTLTFLSGPPTLPSKFISWNSSTDCCSWLGVTCSTNGHVVGLDISSQSISGGIDNSSSLFHLQQLQSLNLADNELFNGTSIPSAIGKLTNLRYLNLSHIYYRDYIYYGGEGKIPVEISQLTRLVVLDISQYKYLGQWVLESPNLSMLLRNLTDLAELYLDGVDISASGTKWCQAISSSLPNLRVLSLSDTLLSGPVDQSLTKLQSLSVLRLDRNDQLSGPIPGFFANFSNLREFSWDGNNVSAPFPRFFANFSKLTSLSLSHCSLQGTFPKEIFQVPTLKIINLSGNEELHGSLPEFPNNGSLRSLDLSSTNFSGSLPSSIENLKLLETIDLSYSSFTGSIPKSMGNLTQLVHLGMSSNRFSGAISSIQWENLINLAELLLYGNLLEGSIPRSIFSLPLLRRLVLSHNQFSGQLSEFSNASSNLFYLDLSFNNLEGPIPVSIFNFRGLQGLSLSSNNFSAFPFNGPQHLKNPSFIDLSYNSLLILYNGTNSSYSSFPQIEALYLASNKLREIPGFLRYQSELYDLDLSKNHIQGEIPHWIWSFKYLYSLNLSCNSLVTLGAPFNTSTVSVLDLHSNQLQGEIPYTLPNARHLDYSSNHFCCSIPADIGNFISGITSFLSLSNNNLSGIIPASICNVYLYFLDLSNNSLSGRVPRCLVTKDLEVLNLRRNNLTGTISNFEFSESCGLDTLDLGENRIKGKIPLSFGNMHQLESLDLSQNKLSGQIPLQLAKLTFLEFLDLSNNQLVGKIPAGTQISTFPKESFMGNKGLWGPPLTMDKKAGLSPPQANGNHPNSRYEIDWDLISVEIGFAFGFAVAVGSLVLCKRWSNWYYRAMYKILVKIFPQLEERIGPHRRHVHINQRW